MLDIATAKRSGQSHDKTYNKTSVTSKDQHVRPPSMARIFIKPSLDSVEGTCEQ